MYVQDFWPIFQSGRIILSSEKVEVHPLILNLPTCRIIGKRIPGYGKFYRPPQKASCCTTNVLCFRKREPPKMNAGPWACVVGEPVVVPWSVHSDGTCQSRSLICYVVPRVISLLRRRLIHVYIYLAQVPPHQFSDSSLDRTCELVLFRKLSTPAVLLIDFSTCRGIVLAVCAF